MDNKVQDLMGVSIDKIREMVDVSTVIGDPMTLADGTTLIPVSRVSYGFATGGSDLPTKGTQELFGGGGGAGINIIPIAFLVVSNGNVRVLPLVASPDTFNQVVNMVPDVVNKIGDLFSKDKEQK
ncbi:MAG: sporulation protein YtfJ [Clostridia bacterium]|nr:sporulation protein YtfJ [Clostridia bacterium]